MAFGYKKEYKESCLPPKQSDVVEMPKMSFLAVRGKGDPSEESGEYKRVMGLLYGMVYTIKMSYRDEHVIKGFFEYVVSPLEGPWWQEGIRGVDCSRKNLFQWISLIRLPNFMKEGDFGWALEEATRRKKMDLSQVEFFPYDKGLYVQCMHLDSYDNESATIRQMETYTQEHGYTIDIANKRHHYEVYLSGPRRTEAAKLKIVVRRPVREV